MLNRPDLSVRSRKGYYSDRAEAVPVSGLKEEIQRALWSPLEAKGIRIVARLLREQDALRVVARSKADHLSLQEVDGRWKGDIDVVTSQQDSKGQNLNSTTQSAAVDIDRHSHEYYLMNGIPYTTRVQLAPESRELRLVVVDRTTGALGSVIVPLGDVR